MSGKAVLPLERRTIIIIENGAEKLIPAIHQQWLTERAFPRYSLPPLKADKTLPLGAEDSWMELANLFLEDLEWLFNAPYHCFWSRIILTKAPSTAVTSFLQESCPPYCAINYPQQIQDMLTKLNKVVFSICRRLATDRESDENFITKTYLGNVLYENYIFTVPSLLDICALYGVGNRKEVEKLLVDVTTIQPKYLEDFSIAEPHLITVFENTEKLICENSKKNKEVKDILVHVYDSLVTMRLFVEILPKGGQVFATPQFLAAISSFYTTVIPKVSKIDEIQGLVENLRVECLRYVRTVLQSVVAKIIEEKSSEHVEIYLSLVSEIMSDGLFISDYHLLNPLDVDFDIIIELFTDIDLTKFEYLLEALASHVDLKLKKKEKPEAVSNIVNYPSTSQSQPSSSQISGVKLLSLVSEVQDILPHLGAGFVEACLKYYDYSTERVIAAVLENTLPPSIEELNWNLDKTPEVAPVDNVEEVVAYRGKKPRGYKNVKQMLSDKTEINEMRDRFVTLGYEEEDYNDEYDDTYEGQDVGLKEPDEAEKRRPFVTPRVLEVRQVVESEEEEEEEQPERNRNHFVQNPEEVRARAEAKRQASRQWNQRDVVGKPKGQGQDKQVVQNRDKKGTQKSSMGNHNRRDRASRKRNQGMIPS